MIEKINNAIDDFINNICDKVIKFLKYKITPAVQSFKIRNLIVLTYLTIVSIIWLLININNLTRTVFLTIVFLFFSFYLLWGISTIIMYAQSVERPLPVIDRPYIRKPGRYIAKFGRYEELRTSPVDDYYGGVIIGSVIILVALIMMLVKKELSIYWIIHIIVANSLAVLKETKRLEDDYLVNMKKAKQLFMECDGDLELLKDDKKYYEYQPSLEYEEMWMAELEKIKKNKAK